MPRFLLLLLQLLLLLPPEYGGVLLQGYEAVRYMATVKKDLLH